MVIKSGVSSWNALGVVVGMGKMRCSPQRSGGGNCSYAPKRKAPPKSATGVSLVV